MAFINFKDQWFQELRKVNWLVRECVEEKCRPFGITPEQEGCSTISFWRTDR